MTGGLLLTDAEISELAKSPEKLAEYERILRAATAQGFHRAWRGQARPEQVPPDGEWRTLFLRGGRGGGKTHAAARTLGELIAEDPLGATEGPGQWAVVAPTYSDVRDTCVEGESGLLAALGTSAAEVATSASACSPLPSTGQATRSRSVESSGFQRASHRTRCGGPTSRFCSPPARTCAT